MDPVDGKFASFGWQTFAVQGNDMERVVKTSTRPGLQGPAHLHSR